MTDHPDAYVGPDRRQRLPRVVHQPNRRLLATVGLAVLVYGVAIPTGVAEALGPSRSVPAANIATIVCAILFAQGGLLLLLQWRLTGDGRSFQLGVAGMVYGFFIAPLTEGFGLLGVDVVHRAAGQSLAQSCVGMVAAVFAVRAVNSPQVDSRLRPGRSLGWAAALLAVVCSAAYVADRLLPTHAHHYFSGAVAGVAALVWLSAGGAVLWQGRGGKVALSTLLAGPFLVLGLGSVSWLISMFRQVPFSLDASALTMSAGVLLAGGAAYALLTTLSGQGASAFRLRALLRNLEQYRAFEEERVHDARSALLAVQTAITALTRYRERLDDQSRTNLELAVDSELERLVGLMGTPTPPVRAVECRPFDVVEPVVSVTTAAAAFGLRVELDVPEAGCWVVGNRDDTARVLESLLDNARRYATGSPIGVGVHPDGGTVRVTVSDAGPGIAADERDVVFARGGRGRTSEGTAGSGLGLFAARRLMEDQDGSLALAADGSPGATFVAVLPAAGPTAGEEPAPPAGPDGPMRAPAFDVAVAPAGPVEGPTPASAVASSQEPAADHAALAPPSGTTVVVAGTAGGAAGDKDGDPSEAA